MRVLVLTGLLLLVGGFLLSGAAGAAEGDPGHEITCSSTRGERSYQEGLRCLHLGKLADAERKFQETLRRDPACAMAHWGFSRVLSRSGRAADALAAAARAEEHARGADDREQQLIALWARHLKAAGEAEADRKKKATEILRDADRAIAVYSYDPEVWILRGELSESALRGAPFYLAALQLQPEHALGKVWSATVPPLPDVQPAPTQPVPALPEAPVLFEGLGKLSHPITTSSSEAQAYYEQGLRCFHGYVNPGTVKNGAARCFQHAATLDPECAMAYWGLSFCTTTAMKGVDAANRALELALKKGTDKERRFCAARVLELSGREKREAFLDALDGAIAAYPQDVELWTWRGKVFSGYGSSPAAGPSIPYQLAAHRLQPEHPGPNHELTHAYEGIDRPALGWRYSVGFRQSAYNLPHAHHMQSHLAMRLGRWQDAIDATRLSRRKGVEGYPELDPTHHIDIMIRALAHEGRFAEAEAEPRAYRDGLPWARLLQLKLDSAALAEWADRRRERNAPDGFYVGAIVRLNQGDLAAAKPLIDNVEEQFKKNSANANLYRFHELKGRYMVQSGQVDEGLKLLREAAAKAVKDAGLHAWGGGSYILEVWGEAALRARRWDEAEEAFHEALAHEHGSILGALGMQVVWEQRGRMEMAQHYAARSERIWKDADPGARERQLERLRKLAAASVARTGVVE